MTNTPTPRTDAQARPRSYEFAVASWVRADFARELERELAQAHKQVSELEVVATVVRTGFAPPAITDEVARRTASRALEMHACIAALKSRLARVTEALDGVVALLAAAAYNGMTAEAAIYTTNSAAFNDARSILAEQEEPNA